jgi:putative transposase
MVIRKGYKFRLNTSPADEALMRQFAGCSRFLWNKALALQKGRLDDKQSCLSYNKLANMLPAWKKEHPFLADAPSQALQQTLKALDKAIKEAFDKANPKRFPVLKKRGHSRDSFRYPQGFDISNARVLFPKIGWIGFRKSQFIKGKPKNVTVSRDIDHWYVSIQTEQKVSEPAHPSVKTVGIDLGIKKMIAQSDGNYIAPINSFRKAQAKLAKLQRQLARKVKVSSNWHKRVKKIHKLHWHIANIRKDYLHKASYALSKSHAIVCMEDLQVRNMSKSASGTIEKAGRNVRAKSGLNKAILDQGWGELTRQLSYKQYWRGGVVVLIPPQYTSQQCSECVHVETDNRPSRAVFHCQACGHTENADTNAAKNILREGLSRLARPEKGAAFIEHRETVQSGRSLKQEIRSRLVA